MEKIDLKKFLKSSKRNNMDPYKWIKQSFIRIFFLAIIITGLVGLIIGKVTEASIYLEIGKWLVIALVAGFSSCVLLSPIVAILDPIRDKMFPEYREKWWINNTTGLFKY